MNGLNIGFTGTREQPSALQRNWLNWYFTERTPARLHHGCCVGADAERHR